MEKRNPFEDMKIIKNKTGGSFPEEKLESSYREIADTFFGKSAPSLSGKQKPNAGRKKAFLFAAIVLLLTLALGGYIIILNIKRQSAYNTSYNKEALYSALEIVKNGEINRANIEEVYFDADAKEESSFLKNSLKLVNRGEYGRAALVIRFRETLSFKEKNILILGRAKHGTKKISLSLKDSRGRINEYKDIRFFSDWSLKNVYLSEKPDFDLGHVKEIKIEFGSHTAGNEKDATIYIKDIVARGVI